MIDTISEASVSSECMAKVMKHADVIALLRRLQGERNSKQFAQELGISASYLSDIYLGKRSPGKKILSVLGLKRRTSITIDYIRGNPAAELKATTRNLQASAF